MYSRKIGIKAIMAAGKVTEKVSPLLNSQWPYGESEPYQFNFYDIVIKVAIPSWRTGKVSESKSTELLM